MFTQYERQGNQLCVLIAVHGELLEHPALLLSQNTPVNQKGHISITWDLFNKTTKSKTHCRLKENLNNNLTKHPYHVFF